MDYLTIGLLLVTVALWIGYMVGLYFSARKMKRVQLRLSKEFGLANALLQDLKSQLAILEHHSQEYFYTLFDAQLPHLRKIIAAVEGALAIAEELRRTGSVDDSLDMVCWILGSRKTCKQRSQLDDQHIEYIKDWRVYAKDLLKECVISLEAAHQKNQDLGVKRNRKTRRSTATDLEKLRSGLLVGQVARYEE